MTETHPDITIVVVLYNSASVIESCLKQFSSDQRIIAVDNASSDGSAEKVSALHPQAKVIQNFENNGYGPAANQGLAEVETPYALLINPDAVMNSGAISLLLKTANENPNVGIVAPFLHIPDKGLELDLKGPKGASYDSPTTIPEGIFSTWFATGAVWLTRLQDWQSIGGFDEKIFLYAEDLDYCLRLIESGKSIIIVPNAKGEHLLSRSTPLTPEIQWRKEWNIIWSHLYVTRKHLGRTKARSEIWRLLRRHFPKMIFYALVFERKRFRRDMAIVNAALAFMRGRTPSRN